MNKYEIDIKIKGNFPNSDLWQTIIMQWIQNNKDYLEENNFDDAPYWHNEMANISCLVGAIWKIGGVAISEYTINKDTYDEQNNIISSGQNNNGRADLYFSINKTKYLVESKYIRHYYNNGTIINVTEKLIKSEICTALKDCQSCNETGLNNKMAMVFVAPNNTNQSINFQEFDYDIKVMLKIVGNTQPKYNGNIYNTIYLFGQHYASIDSKYE